MRVFCVLFFFTQFLPGLCFSQRHEVTEEPTDSFFLRGVQATKKRDYRSAVSLFSEALRLEKLPALSYCKRAFAYFRLREYDKALADVNKALELNPKLADAYVIRAKLLGAERCSFADVKKALVDVDIALDLDRDSGDA